MINISQPIDVAANVTPATVEAVAIKIDIAEIEGMYTRLMLIKYNHSGFSDFPCSVSLSMFTEPIADGMLIDRRVNIMNTFSTLLDFVSIAITMADKKPAYAFKDVLCSFLTSKSYSIMVICLFIFYDVAIKLIVFV